MRYNGLLTAKLMMRVIGFALLVGLLMVPVWTWALDIPNGTPMDMAALPCDGFVGFLDTDGAPENGAEVSLIYRMNEDSPRAIIYYHAGDAGGFERAVVQLPGSSELHFTTLEALGTAFPTPCDIVERESL